MFCVSPLSCGTSSFPRIMLATVWTIDNSRKEVKAKKPGGTNEPFRFKIEVMRWSITCVLQNIHE